ncbi:MAG: hypothetical protein EB084_11250 [Proteobacteria bacterium]|nr:hypothetical protein [Pseudomonadota bacterium]
MKTDRDLSAYDTATGACVGSIARITPDHTLELLPQIDGEAVVLTNKTVMFTNANLEEMGWGAYPWEVRGYEILPDGAPLPWVRVTSTISGTWRSATRDP